MIQTLFSDQELLDIISEELKKTTTTQKVHSNRRQMCRVVFVYLNRRSNRFPFSC